MNRIFAPITAMLLIFAFSASYVCAESGAQSAEKTEQNFFSSVVVPAMAVVKKALPPAPTGWVVAAETQIEPASSDGFMGKMRTLHFSYEIVYRRIEGVKEEKKRLDDAYMESSERNEEAAKPQIERLIKNQSLIAGKLRKATRRKNQAEMKRLNDEMGENGQAMRALHEETEKKIAGDVEKYLVKDAEASIRVTVNGDAAELPHGGTFSMPGAAFALRREGERAGATVWREGQTLILYGDWQPMRNGVFRAKGNQRTLSSKAKTITILVTGEKNRADRLLAQANLEAILSLMK